MFKSSLAILLVLVAMPAIAQLGTLPDRNPGNCPGGGACADVLELEPHASAGSLPGLTLPTNWNWLAGTYWYVPRHNLPAYIYDAQSQASVIASDQTVFHIAASEGGYFRGVAVVQIGTARASFVMLGVVTPDGSVILDFLPTSTPGVATTGSGRFTYVRRQIAMLNQMSSSPNERLRVLHWAYMLQTQPGDPSWDSLPGVDVSVPQFLSGM